MKKSFSELITLRRMLSVFGILVAVKYLLEEDRQKSRSLPLANADRRQMNRTSFQVSDLPPKRRPSQHYVLFNNESPEHAYFEGKGEVSSLDMKNGFF